MMNTIKIGKSSGPFETRAGAVTVGQQCRQAARMFAFIAAIDSFAGRID
jgi:hypothetical protein